MLEMWNSIVIRMTFNQIRWNVAANIHFENLFALMQGKTAVSLKWQHKRHAVNELF